MENNGINQQDNSNTRPWLSLVLIIIHYFIGLFVGQFLGVLLAMLLFGINLDQIEAIFSNFQNEPNGKYVLFCLQFGAAVGAFIIAPLIYLHRIEKRSFRSFFNRRAAQIIPLFLTVVVTISFMHVNAVFIEWNSQVSLPEWLDWLEEILIAQEEQAEVITETLTRFNSLNDFLLAFLIVAILPAVGEELLFRGLVQPKLQEALGNPHIAIWLTSFIFAALHFQFFGLVPRMFLGAIFGYLYYWSGSLLLPMLAHLINNGYSLLLLYLHQQGTIEQDITEAPSLPYTYILVFLLLGSMGFWYFRWYFNQPIQAANE